MDMPSGIEGGVCHVADTECKAPFACNFLFVCKGGDGGGRFEGLAASLTSYTVQRALSVNAIHCHSLYLHIKKWHS